MMKMHASHGTVQWRRLFTAALLASASAVPAYAATAGATAGTAVEEVIVTATKRSENLQNVPISVQALSPKLLAQHQVTEFDDYAKLLPSVSFQSFGPGQAQLFFRGITSGGDGLHGGALPTSGLYIDETPVTTIANSVDLHVYDISRVEALSGPQGTLFGASSLSGTLRIITNPPEIGKFSAGYDLEGNQFGKGAAGGVAQGFVNLPINEKGAIRLVGFYEHDGGYIDNVPKSRTYTLGDDNATQITVNNSKYAKKDFNDVDTYGGRAALKVNLDEHWTVTPSVIFQQQKANGTFLFDPKLGDLAVADFTPDVNKDQWYQAALTIQGKIGNWDVLYSGSYMGRTTESLADYSYYTVAYETIAPAYITFQDANGQFLDPTQLTGSHDNYIKQTNELRVTSPADKPLRLVAGVFTQHQVDQITANYIVPGVGSIPNSPAVPGAGDNLFYTRLVRIDRDYALFADLSYDFLPNLTVSAGVRGFKVDNSLFGFSGFQSDALKETCLTTTATDRPCDDVNKRSKQDGETHKFNLTWKIDPERMVYVTYSTGYRPGGNNRRPTVPPYAADTLTNYEVGWKTTWFNGSLRVNGALFREDWKNVQYGLSPPGFAGVTSVFNAGNALSQGIEGDINWRATDQLTLSLSGTALDAHLTSNFCSYSAAGIPDCTPPGTELPVQPKLKLNTTARYDFDLGSFRSFVQAAGFYQSDARSFLQDSDANSVGPMKGFATMDLSAGVARSNWTFEVYIQNVFDKRGELDKNTVCATVYCGVYARTYPIKPQIFGVKFGQKFN